MTVVAWGLGLGAPRAESGGIPLGPFEFYPSLNLQAGDNNNLFNQVDDPPIVPVSDRYLLARAPLIWRLPFHASSWDLAYTAGWNGYQQNKGLEGTTQEYGTRLRLAFASGAALEMLGGRLEDYLSTTAFDPGGEVSFGDSNFALDTGVITYTQPLSPRHGFQLRTSYEALHFDATFSASYVNYREVGSELSYLNSLGRSTTLFVDLVGGRQDQERTLIEIGEDRWGRRGLQVGIERRFERTDRARFYLGYENLTFVNSDDADFSGLTGRAYYGRLLGGGLTLNGDLIRAVSPSVFNVNNFYVSNRFSLDLDWRPGPRIFYRLYAGVSQNAYPEPAEQFCRSKANPEIGVPPEPGACELFDTDDPPDGIPDSPALLFPPEIIGLVRRDAQFRGRAGIGYQFSRTAALELAYDYTHRDSNMDPFDFTTARLSLEFRFGFAPDRERI